MHRREAVDEAVRIRKAGSVEQRGRGRPLHQPSRIHHCDLVRDLDEQREVMRDEQRREPEPVAKPDQLLEDLSLRDDVEGGRRLVEDHHLGFERERHRDHRPLPHATGQLVRVAPEPVGIDADQLEHRPRHLMSGGSRQVRPMHTKHVVELGTDADHRVESVHRALQHDRDLGPPHRAQRVGVGSEHVDGPARSFTADRLGVEKNLAVCDHGRRTQQADGGQRERGLATSTLTGQAQHASSPQDQVAIDHRVNSLFAVAVIDAEAADLEDRLRPHLPARGDAGLASRHRVRVMSCNGGHAQLRARDDARFLRRAARKARSAQPRVDELVDAEVQQGESGAEEGDAKARRRPPPPPPAANRVVRESLAQHLPPVPESWRR